MGIGARGVALTELFHWDWDWDWHWSWYWYWYWLVEWWWYVAGVGCTAGGFGLFRGLKRIWL